MTTFTADPGKQEIASSSGVVLPYEAGVTLLACMNRILSPVPMKPWPGFLGTIEETISERASLHEALLQCKAGVR